MMFSKKLASLVRFMSLPKAQRRITFYCENKNYWPHLEGLVHGLLQESRLPVCYISSSFDDPGLNLKHPRFHPFCIGDGFIRDWLFQNIDTDYMIMTMPDLHCYQVKRSRHKVHYIYVQHSLVSLHMVYRPGAFNHYDTLCCAGPHHVREVRALEEAYNLQKKRIIEHGYARLDSLIKTARHRASSNERSRKCILIAPSWGPEGVIESGLGDKLRARINSALGV